MASSCRKKLSDFDNTDLPENSGYPPSRTDSLPKSQPLIAKKVTSKGGKPFGERLASYLERFQEDKDVMFICGPEKEEIKALKIAMKASHPAIETLFTESWDTSIAKEGAHRISLPDVDPQAFKIFLKILFLDDWSTQVIKAMKLSPETAFNLIAITKQFKVTELEETLIPLTASFSKNFDTFSKSKEFLRLSSGNLEILLSNDDIAVKEFQVFEAAARWADAKCADQKIPPDGENMRKLLGCALFQIRFPLMSIPEFTHITRTLGLLTEEEQLHTYKFIGERQMSHAQNPNLNQNKNQSETLPFSSKIRNSNNSIEAASANGSGSGSGQDGKDKCEQIKLYTESPEAFADKLRRKLNVVESRKRNSQE